MLHVQSFNRSYESAISTVMGPEGMKCRAAPRDDYSSWINLTLLIKRPRILVMAPSNIGVDNVIERVLDSGFLDGNGGPYFPSMLRLGSGSKRSKVRVISLEETTEHIMGLERDEVQTLKESVTVLIRKLVQEIFNVQTLLLHLKEAYERYEVPEGVELRVDRQSAVPYWVDHNARTTLNQPPPRREVPSAMGWEAVPEYAIYTSHLAPLLDQLRHQSLQLKRLNLRDSYLDRPYSYRTLIETSFIDDAHIVFTTLNSSGHASLDSSIFDVMVIDEAGQCTEPSTLIPLKLSCEQCLLVGDPMQLPATIFSIQAKNAGLDKSLFERLMKNGHEVTLLDTQYRMLPEISTFPSKMFYQGKLKDGRNVHETCPPYIISTTSLSKTSTEALFPPFLFFDLKSSRDEIKNSLSRSNYAEAVFCKNLLIHFLKSCVQVGSLPSSIGIITPYTEQLNELDRLFAKIEWSSLEIYRPPDIELNTVDSYQGREKDVIFISCVRANDEGSIGFLSDLRRMNVALTRGKFGVYIIGHAETLRGNKMWSKLISHAEETKSMVSVEHAHEDLSLSLKRKAEFFAADAGQNLKRAKEEYLKVSVVTKQGSKDVEEGELLEASFPQESMQRFLV